MKEAQRGGGRRISVSCLRGGLLHLFAAVLEVPGGEVPVVSIVGGGGKTSTLFAFARRFSSEGRRVLVTTTTHILHPDAGDMKDGRGFGPVVVSDGPISSQTIARLREAGPRTILAGGVQHDGSRLSGIAAEDVAVLREHFDVVLVEADGSRGLPVKAPAAHEPVVPRATTALIGCIGLDALGAPMDARHVHRPQLFGPLTGCAPGEAITAAHIARLVESPAGLFSSAPAGARRLVLLNKADLVSRDVAEGCAEAVCMTGACSAVFIDSVGKAGAS